MSMSGSPGFFLEAFSVADTSAGASPRSLSTTGDRGVTSSNRRSFVVPPTPEVPRGRGAGRGAGAGAGAGRGAARERSFSLVSDLSSNSQLVRLNSRARGYRRSELRN